MKTRFVLPVGILACIAIAILLRLPTQAVLPSAPSTEIAPHTATISAPAIAEIAVKVLPESEPKKYYVPPPVKDKKLAALVNRDAKDRIFTNMAARFPEVQHPEDFPALLSVLTDVKDDDTVRHEVAFLLMRSHCPDLVSIFFKILDSPEEQPRFRAFTMQYLFEMVQEFSNQSATEQLLTAKMRASLDDKNFEVRTQALQNLCRLKDEVGLQTAVKWLDYSNYKPVSTEKTEFERATILKQAIEQIHAAGLKEHLDEIRQHVKDANAIIARAAIVTLADWKDTESLPLFQEAAKSSDPLLKSCAQTAIKKMAAP